MNLNFSPILFHLESRLSKSEESEPLGRSSDCVAASGGFLLLLRPRAEDTFDSGELITI
jgi:hypothetical protein